MIHKHTCDNGLRIVLEQAPSVRSVTIGVWIYNGSRHEPEHLNGMSHFIEHMLFKGTEKRSAVEIVEGFESIGGQVNAFTDKEYTCYYAQVLASYKEEALDILADMFFNSTFPNDEIDRERKVIHEEINIYEDDGEELVHDLLIEQAYEGHAIGRNILGTDQHIDSFTRHDMVSYMNQTYSADKVVISVVGNVDESFIPTVEAAFDHFSNEHYNHKHVKPTFTPNKIVREKEAEQAHLTLAYEGLSLTDDKMMSLLVASNALGGGMSSRLFQEIREKRGLAYAVYADHIAYIDSGMFMIYAGTNPADLPYLQETIAETMNDFVREGLTEKELKSSKEQLKGNMMIALESTSSRMTRNGRNELMLNRIRTLDELIDDINSVTMADTNDMIQNIFTKQYAQAIVKPHNS